MSGSTSLVTGGASGLGLATAHRLARRGDTVYIADIDQSAIDSAIGSIRTAGGRAHGVVMDVSLEDSVTAGLDEIDAASPIDAVAHCAGIAFGSPVRETTLEQWDRLMRVNLTGTFLVVREAARRMVPRRSGSIVATASTSSFTASSTPMAGYDASKAAVMMFVKSVARELAPHGVRVNAIAPGTMDTALVRGLGATDASLEALSDGRIPAGRLGTTEEVAAAAEWLTSPGASYVVGHTLVVDGGWLT